MADQLEGSPWFWKIFGGAIMGAITFLLVAHITTINANIERSKTELRLEFAEFKTDMRDLKSSLDNNKEKMMEIGSLKEKLDAAEKAIKEISVSLDERKQKIAALEATTNHLTDEVKALREQNEKLREKITPVTPPAPAP